MSIFTIFAAATPTKEWDIDAMLASPAMVQAFHAFCTTRCCEEFVEFLQDTHGAYRHRLTTVVGTYIQRSNEAFGGKTIVIPQALRQAVLTTFDMYKTGALGDAFGAMALENTIEAARLDVLRTLQGDWAAFKKTDAFAAIANEAPKKARPFRFDSASPELCGRAAPLAA